MFTILGPVIILLLLVSVFGGTLWAGLPGVDPNGGRDACLAHVLPGILVMTIAGTAGGTVTAPDVGSRYGNRRSAYRYRARSSARPRPRPSASRQSASRPTRPEADAVRGIRIDPSSGVLCGQSGLSRA